MGLRPAKRDEHARGAQLIACVSLVGQAVPPARRLSTGVPARREINNLESVFNGAVAGD